MAQDIDWEKGTISNPAGSEPDWESGTISDPNKPRTRGLFEAVNDNVIEFANAAAGGVSALANFVKPGNAVSGFIDENIIKSGEQKQSDVVQGAKRQLSEGLQNAQGIGEEVGAVGSYVLNNPLLAASQAAGSFALPGGAVKGAGSAAKALGAGAKGIETAGRVGGIAAGAAMAGGDAAGTAYDLASKAGATEDQALAAGRQASVIPALVGGVTGAFGAERLLAGAKGFGGNALSRGLKSGLSEAGQEAVEEGVTQFEGQRAAMPYDSTIDPTKGVAGAAAMGGIMGFGPGAVLGAMGDGAAKPSQQMGIDPGAGPLSRAAAASVDSAPPPQLGFSPLAGTPIIYPDGSVALNSEQEFQKRNPGVQQGMDLSKIAQPSRPLAAEKKVGQPVASEQKDAALKESAPVAPVSESVPLEQRSLDELRQAFRSAQEPAIRKTLAAEIRKRREAMPDPLAPVQPQQEIALEPQAVEAVQSQPQEAQAIEGVANAAQTETSPAVAQEAAASPASESGVLGDAGDPAAGSTSTRATAGQPNKLKEARDARRAADVLRGTRNSSSGAGSDIADAGVANDVGSPDRTTGAAAPVVPQQGQPGVGERPTADQAALRPDGWRTTAIKAGKVARSLGLDPKGKRLKEIVAEIDAVDAGTNVQNTPSSTAGTEAKAAPVEARAPEGGNAASDTGVPAAPGAGDVQADGVKEAWGLTREQYFNDPARVRREAVGPAAVGWKASYEYTNPSGSGPFKGSTVLKVKPNAGDTINAPFGRARVTAVSAVKGASIDNAELLDIGKAHHRRVVADAIASGKPVPDDVLAEYPDLSKNQRELNTSAEPVQKTSKNEQVAQADGVKSATVNESLTVQKPAAQAEKPSEQVNPEPSKAAQPKAEKPAEEAPAPKKNAEKIEDFGEKLAGARKDYAATLKDAMSVDVAAEPLSKSWPEPDYQKLLDGGADPFMVAWVHAARDEIPTKPQTSWKLSGWVKSVKLLRKVSADMLAGEVTKERLQEMLEKPEYGNLKRQLGGRAELYQAVGHGKSLKGITFMEHHYSMYRNEKNVTKWAVEMKAKSSSFGGWPREIAVADTKADALAQFKEKYDGLQTGAKSKGAASFAIYRKRGEAGAFIGKKIGREYIDLYKAEDVKAARTYLADNTDKLEKALERYKDTPYERGEENAPRVGGDHRNGAPVTPEVFGQTFGFRGVQFGNYVEQGRRQSDLNEAFDALMDMAAVLGIPPKAISLNGRLGLAFGARGKGGKNAPAAHYETGNMVINLTKGGGPGSLAHEWFHAMDNYFAKQGGDAGYMTDGATGAALREEMRQAFKAVKTAINAGALKLRSLELDKRRTKPYWSTPVEMAARSFESYVIAKLQDQNASNDYLANVVDQKVWDISEAARSEFFTGQKAGPSYPYPTVDELPALRAAFDDFFKVVQTRETEDGNTEMYFGSKDRGQGTPVDRAIMDMAGEGREANEILSFIAKSSKSPYRRQLAQKLLATGANPAVSLGGEMGGGAGFRFLAKYSRKNHEVTISEAAADRAEQIFLHETVHSATLLALDKGGLIATQMRRLAANVYKDASPEMRKMYGLVLDKRTGEVNVGEFVAEAFTNPDFQKSLKGMKADNGSLWDRLVNIVRRILGMDPKEQDALSAALDLGAKVMRENMPLRAARSFRAEDGPAYMRTEDTRAAFDARIDELFSGAQANRVGTRVLNRSDVMSMLGYDDKPMVLAESKVTQGTENHPEMTAEVWKKIPGWLENPAAVFDSDTDGGLVVIAPEMVGGKAVSIIVRPDGERRNALNVHLLLNAYSRSPNTPYQRWISQGLLRYVDQKKFPALFEAVAGRQLPGTALQNKPGTKRILTEKNLVGWRKANPEDEANFGIADAVEQIKQFDVKSAPKSAWAHYRGMSLQALGRRQLVDLYGDEFGPHLKQYDYLVQQMDAEKNETGAAADDIAQRWGKLKDEKALAELMHDATLAKMDPDKPMPAGYSKAEYDRLKTRFNTLSPEAKTLYREARDMYIAHYKAVQQAIKDRIERSEMSPSQKKQMMASLDDKLFKELQGVYFPLARFGQYVIVVKDANGQVVNVTRAETVKEAEQARKELQKAFPASSGNTVGKVLKQAEFNAGRDAVGKGFMADLMNALDEKGVDDELRDTVAQLYLSSLPDLSWAKHGIHRKGTPGFSQDARRAFAQNSFHGARYLAKLRYSDQLQDELSAMQEYVKAFEGVEEYDSIQGQQVVDEMVKRHEILMNPKASPVSTALTSFGFLFHMGLSPASAMVNLTQTALVAYPQMGAKWGFTKAGAALAKASEEVVRAKNDLSKSLKGEELAAFERAVKDGTIDVTMAHDLAGIAQGEDQGVMWKIRPVMRWASFMFHHAEKFNRQATFVAAYRLSKEANPEKPFDWHYEAAKKATYDGHYDYSSANRPRLMQGNWQRVILLFKAFAQNTIYTLARNAYQSVKALDPKERSQARKTLGGILAAHAAAAGVLGLPIVGPMLAAASWIGGDDDEPWDAEVAMQNAMAEMIGPKAAEVVARGFSRLTPFDLSGRVALNKLILPDVQEGLEGKEWAESAMAAALGPVAGIGVNMARGAQKITEGDYMRGLEDMMPTALRGPLKAMRYANEGAVDKTGVTITEDVSAAGVLGQASGFSPSQVRRDTERRSAIYSYDRALLERRSVLMRMFAQAQMSGDLETAQEVRQDIQRFNEKNPTRRITPMNLAASIRNRRKRIEEAEQGVYLPSKRRDALEAVTF